MTFPNQEESDRGGARALEASGHHLQVIKGLNLVMYLKCIKMY